MCASTRGLGYASAKGLLEAGSSVILTGRSESGLKDAKANLMTELKNAPNKGSIFTIKVDQQ